MFDFDFDPDVLPVPDGVLPLPTRHGSTLFLFHRGLALCSLLAFVATLRGGVTSLMGTDGLSPASEQLKAMKDTLRAKESRRFRRFLTLLQQCPSLLWIHCSNASLYAICIAGTCASLWWLITPWLWHLMAAICLVCYSSIVTVPGPFFHLQMHCTILEAIFLTLASSLAGCGQRAVTLQLWAARWLLFRTMLGCGLCKWYGSKSWRDGTAMEQHYATQPLPNRFSWYFHHLPKALHRLSARATLFVELLVAPLALAPWWPAKMAAFAAFNSMLALINVSGNYGFLGMLTFVESFPLLEDWMLPSFVRQAAAPWLQHECAMRSPLTEFAFSALVILHCLISLVPLCSAAHGHGVFGWLEKSLPSVLGVLYDELRFFRICNRYAKFGSMRTFRFELVIEGSIEGDEWHAYGNLFKPWDPMRAPPVLSPWSGATDGVDWRVWFLPSSIRKSWTLRRVPQTPEWYQTWIMGLLLGNPAALNLVSYNPFPPHSPPKLIRTTVYACRFTTPDERRATGAWWRFERLGELHKPVQLPHVQSENEDDVSDGDQDMEATSELLGALHSPPGSAGEEPRERLERQVAAQREAAGHSSSGGSASGSGSDHSPSPHPRTDASSTAGPGSENVRDGRGSCAAAEGDVEASVPSELQQRQEAHQRQQQQPTSDPQAPRPIRRVMSRGAMARELLGSTSAASSQHSQDFVSLQQMSCRAADASSAGLETLEPAKNVAAAARAAVEPKKTL